MKKAVIIIACLISITMISGCAEKKLTIEVKSPRKLIYKKKLPAVARLIITPNTAKLVPGGSIQFAVLAYDRKGKHVTVNADWRVISEEPAVGTLDVNTGDKVIFNAQEPGNGTVEAEFNNLKATADFEVFKLRR